MAFFNDQKRSKRFGVTLLIVSVVLAFSLPLSVYATEDNPREPTSSAETLIDNDGIVLTENPVAEPPTTPPTEDSSTEEPVQESVEVPSAEPPTTPPTADPSTDVPVQEPVENPEQEVPSNPDLTIYVVEYETADGEKLLQDKVVADQMVGIEISEDAVVIEGYSVDESLKSITLAQDENLITFIYKVVEPAEEELPPVEEELPPVVELPVIEEEVVTEPAIVVEPTAATLTIVQRLIVDGEVNDVLETVDGLRVGQSISLADYIVNAEYVVCISDLSEMTLSEESATVILEYNLVETDLTESLPN